MSIRRLKMSDETAEFVRTLHPDIKRKIKAALQAVLNDPLSGKALKDELDGLQSFKVGKFRVIYKTAPDKGIIEVAAIGPRKTIYEETLRLLQRDKL
ncbi:MAG: type II toxin-antitoxin system RelE/ParE family toxin [Nitrospirae bacterium]|nr:type II toxin-antitoxin system RelE/ParE family toxin [Nitrospirota bacterium]